MRDERGRFVSKKVAAEIANLENDKAALTQQAEAIDARLAELGEEGIDISTLAREVAKEIILAMCKGFEFNAAELELIKPTPIDPIIRYKGETVVWYI